MPRHSFSAIAHHSPTAHGSPSRRTVLLARISSIPPSSRPRHIIFPSSLDCFGARQGFAFQWRGTVATVVVTADRAGDDAGAADTRAEDLVLGSGWKTRRGDRVSILLFKALQCTSALSSILPTTLSSSTSVVPPASPHHDDMARFSPLPKAIPLILVTVISLYLLPIFFNHIFGRPTPIALALVSLTDTLEHVFVALALSNAVYVVWMTIYDMCAAMSSVDDEDENIPVPYPLPFDAVAQDLEPSPPDVPPLPLGIHGASLSKRFGSMAVTIPLFGLLIDKHRDESLNAPSAASREAALAAVVSFRKALAVLGGAMMTTFVGGVLCILWDRFGMGQVGGDEGRSDVEDKLTREDGVHAGRSSRRSSSLAPAQGTSTPSSSSFSKPAAILLLIVLSLAIYLAPALIDYICSRPTPVAASFVWVAGLLDHGLAAFVVENAVYEARMILIERRISNSSPSPAPTPWDAETGHMVPDTTRSLAKRLLLLTTSLLVFLFLAIKHNPTLSLTNALSAPLIDTLLDVLEFFLVGSSVVAGVVIGRFVGVILWGRGRAGAQLGDGAGGLDVEGVSVPLVVDDKARMSGMQEGIDGPLHLSPLHPPPTLLKPQCHPRTSLSPPIAIAIAVPHPHLSFSPSTSPAIMHHIFPRPSVRRCGYRHIRLRAWNGVFVGCRRDSLDMLDVPGVVDTTERATFLLHERHPSIAPPRARRLDAAGLVKRLLALIFILVLVTSPTSFGLFIPRHAAAKNSPWSPNTLRAVPRFLLVGIILLLARRRVRHIAWGRAGGGLSRLSTGERRDDSADVV
ncbi:hypothetical protein R3P38DRAFT_3180299 [Favolaschia claudopus]|uniref:Uncharacterized protein n=1 Tax=Favolaschia claudopus TaxID=2862362 RepID=A0AAW0CPV2_9AGAR